MASKSTPADLSDRLVASVSQVGSARTSPGIYRTLLRLLAHGKPVSIAQLAAATGRPTIDVRRTIEGWTDTEYDRQGRIVGYGLTQRPTPHRFTVDGKLLHTWCALDTLFFPAVIGRPAQIESPCAATGIPIGLTVDPVDGVTGFEPATAVVSIATPEQVTSVRTVFCNPGRFFATRDAARGWQAEHPAVDIVPVLDAYKVSRPLSDMLLDGNNPSECCTR